MHHHSASSLFNEPSGRAVHFIAVCGTAMASVAAELHRAGMAVTGSDSAFYPPMGDFLRSQGVLLYQGFNSANLPADGWVVVGNAVSRGNVELEAALDRGMRLVSLPELICRRYLLGRRSVVVAGTHGKTTCTTLLAHSLRQAGRAPGWLAGGMPLDLPTPCEAGQGGEFVIEGDEYDSAWFDKRPKFLWYRPHTVLLTSVEFDHSDIYSDFQAVRSEFRRFVGLMPQSGVLIANGDSPSVREVAQRCPARVVFYGEGGDNHLQLTAASVRGGKQFGSVTGGDGEEVELVTKLPGRHNLLNAVGVFAVLRELGLPAYTAAEGIAACRGVARRLQLVASTDGLLLYDDFAHHPTAIRAGIEGLRSLHPERRLWVLLEPRSNTLVRNLFQQELTEALSGADGVILGPIHRADRIPPVERLDRERIVQELHRKGIAAEAAGSAAEVKELFTEMMQPPATAVIMTNGHFDGLRELLEKGGLKSKWGEVL